ncbi:multidrug efflux protein [Oleiharenicola lentus]|uniref:Multidrug efflux protein n=1 Tax=Oleiharenicola lentus TaxID=2508720 RepID=A0A4V1M6A6_9BACT|nr:efflux RND transporter permease subunit [Oleiharenicola lentus]RXK54729.1 multidrug efflux protein [Oleiharenicola lentus]
MNLTEIFIRRPVLATVLNLFLLIAGWQAIQKLVVRQYPFTSNAVVTVSVAYPGANADLVRGFVTTPLEREIASADGIDFIESVSRQGGASISIRLRLNYDPNDALTQITAKVNRVRGELPAGSEDPIFDVAVGETTPSAFIGFSSETMQSNQITDYLVRVVQPKLSTIPGVQKAEVLGGRVFAMRIWLKPDKMAALGLSAGQVRTALAAQNYLSAVGQAKGSMMTVNLTAQTDLRDVEGFRNIIIRESGTQLVRLRDIADVVLGAENYDSLVNFSGVNGVFIGVSALPTANAIDVIKGVRQVMPEIQEQLPPGLSAKIVADFTEFINDSIHEVMLTLVEAMVIVIIVIYLFLGSFRSVVIPIVAIPLSLVGVCTLMLAMGFSINLLTLLAMVLAIGLVVDDAIVVVENIHRHIEEGLSPFAAAIKGAHELVGPVIAMTITLAAVYAPVGFQSGLTGALFREFAFTLAGAVIISGFVALTLSPVMCARILRHNPNPRGFEALLNRSFDRLQNAYERLLHVALETRGAVFMVAALVFAAIVPFFLLTKSELAPPEDQSVILFNAEMTPTATVEQTMMFAKEVADLIRKDYPVETAELFLFVGRGGTANSAFIGWRLKPWGQRHRTAMQLLPEIQAKVATLGGIRLSAFLRPSLPGAAGGLPVQVVVNSTESHARVAEVSDALLQRAMRSGLFVFGDNNLKFDLPQVNLVIDREKAAALGINMSQLGADLGAMLGGGYVNRFAFEGRAYRVVPQVTRLARLNPDQVTEFYVSTSKGELVPLSSIATEESVVQPRELRRFQQLNAATLAFSPAPGVSQGQALDWIRTEAAAFFPQGFTLDFNGESRQFVQEGSSLMVTFLFAVVAIFLVLAAQYESWRDPFIIMMSVPLSIAGAMVFLFFGFATLNIYTQVGLITLVGLITKHGILIVEFANKLQEEQGMSVRHAVEHAAAVRLRPILMTTAAMVLGVLPLLRAEGAGAESRFSIGLVIATGMSIGTLFTLFVVPAFYTLLAERRHQQKAAAPTTAVAVQAAH